MIERVRIGTRGSALALRQTQVVAALLQAVWPDIAIETQIIRTQGDQVTDIPLTQISSAGVFTSALETALRHHTIDIAVHSLKDLPVAETPGVVIGAIPEREHPADVLIGRAGHTLKTLPAGATVGTSSRRRAAQVRYLRPDLTTLDIRGNVDTRLNKLFAENSPYEAILLAYAGLARLERLENITEVIAPEVMLPAPGQAALAVQCRDEPEWRELLRPLHHANTAHAVNAERAFLAGMGGGCALPVGAYGVVENDRLRLYGRVIAPDGSRCIDVSGEYDLPDADASQKAGMALAQQALARNARDLLEQLT